MTTRRGAPYPSNSNLIFVRGVIDDADPENEDGSPKWIDNATVAWSVLDVSLASLASGSGTSIGNGAYRCDLSHLINFAAGVYIRVIVTTSGGFVANMLDTWTPVTRTGKTPTT